MLSDATLAYGEQVMTALLGVDALYRQESGDEDGLAVLNMDTEGRYTADSFPSYGDAAARWEELRVEALGLPEDDRQVYYQELALSTLAFIQWRRQGISFQDQLSRFLHVPAAPPEEKYLDAARGMLSIIFRTMKLPGDLKAQAAAWEERNAVPPEDVPTVLEHLLDHAWDLTEEHVLPIPAAKSDCMRVLPVTGVAFNAKCDYLNRTIELNVDPVLTRPALKHLAVHEGCPGHYLQFKIRETMAREGTAPADVLLSVVNTASSSVFEGIADRGAWHIGWLQTPDEHVQGLMNTYRAGIASAAAWRLHALGQPEGQVRDWLREQSLVGGEGWVDNRMKFIAAPSRAVLIWSYWWGEGAVTRARLPEKAEGRPDFFRYVYGRMHSIRSVSMYGPPPHPPLPWEDKDDMAWE